MQSNAATISAVLASPAVRSVVLKQLDSQIGVAEKKLAQLRSAREEVASEDAKPSKKSSAAKPTRRNKKSTAKASAKKSSAAKKGKGKPGRPKGQKNRKSGHTKAILTSLASFEDGVAKAHEIRKDCEKSGHKLESGIFHSTMSALIRQGRVTKEGERAEAVYTLVEQQADADADADEPETSDDDSSEE